MERECKHHGLTKHFVRTDGYVRCRKCTSEAVVKRRKKLKKMLVEHFGGACIKCGYNRCIEALVFHHPKDKKFGIAEKGHTRSFKAMLEEAEKCELLCLNCHAETHYKLPIV